MADKTIKMRCPKCRGESFKSAPGPGMKDKVTCANCGHIITVHKLYAPTIDKAAKKVTEALTDAFKKAGFKVKKK